MSDKLDLEVLHYAEVGYRNKLLKKQQELADSKAVQNKRDKILKYLQEARELKNSFSIKIDDFSIFDNIVNKEDVAYRKRRINYLEEYVTANLASIFPTEGYKAKIDCDFKYKQSRVSLELLSKNDEVRIPEVCEGRMCRQLISFSASASLTESLGKKMFYMDEAFAASDSENLSKLGKILKTLLDKDFQIFLIEQHSESYRDLPRREIRLEKDAVKEIASVESIKDI